MSSLAQSPEQVPGWHPGEEMKESQALPPRKIPSCMGSGGGNLASLPFGCSVIVSRDPWEPRGATGF